INASMRVYHDKAFSPWIIARGGNDVGSAGKVIISQPRTDPATFEIEYIGQSGYDVYVNNSLVSSGEQVSARTKLMPSRVLSSYENYPELFDAPIVSDPSISSDSATDVNESDGQEVTGLIP